MKHHVDLQIEKTALEGFDNIPDDPVKLVPPRNRPVSFGRHRIQAYIELAYTEPPEILDHLVQQNAVGCKAQIHFRVVPSHLFHYPHEALANERLTSRKPDLAHPEPGENTDETDELLNPEHLVVRQELYPSRWHAVHTAQVAFIRYRNT